MSYTLSTSEAIIAKMGQNASSLAIVSAALLKKWSDQAEGQVNARTRFDWVAGYSSIGANYKPILDDVVSDLAAIKGIEFDMSGYTTIGEAQTMLDVLKDNSREIISDLKETKTKEPMGAS